MTAAKKTPNFGTMYLRWRREGSAPRGTFREVAPEPQRDMEAELERLAALRREREEWLREVLNAE